LQRVNVVKLFDIGYYIFEYRLTGLMRLAEIYEAEGEPEKGLVIYGDIVRNSKNPEWVAVAKEKMKILMFSTNK